MRATLLRWRFVVRMALGRMPVLYHLVVLNNWVRVRQPHVLVRRDTALVIDGFPSSGNSYGIAALRAAADAEPAYRGRALPPIAHHMHCPRQVIAAAKRDTPVILLVRPPRACIPSALTRWPAFTAKVTLRAYIGYYDTLLSHTGRMVVTPFDRLTSAFGDVVATAKERFGVDLPDYDQSAPYASAVYDPEASGRADRRALVEQARADVEAPEVASLLRRAEALYDRYVALAGLTSRGPGGPSTEAIR